MSEGREGPGQSRDAAGVEHEVVAPRSPAAASFLKRIPAGKLALEVFLIVIGVLLALAVDRWGEAKAQERLVRAVLQTVRVELDRNRHVLAARLAYHDALAKTLHAAGDRFFVEENGFYRLRSADRIPWRKDVGMREGAGLGLAPALSDTAWQAALSSGALSSVDYRLFYQLAVVYGAVADVRHTEEDVLSSLEEFDRAFLERQAPLAAFSAFEGSFQDLHLAERELRVDTAKALAALKASG